MQVAAHVMDVDERRQLVGRRRIKFVDAVSKLGRNERQPDAGVELRLGGEGPAAKTSPHHGVDVRGGTGCREEHTAVLVGRGDANVDGGALVQAGDADIGSFVDGLGFEE